MDDQKTDESAYRLTRPGRQTAGDQAEQALFDAITDGRLAAGSRLRLHDLADQLGMSIVPVREALTRLEGFGLVESVAHKGATVRPTTVEDLYDTYFTRIHLESLAIWTAAKNVSEVDVEVAEEALLKLQKARQDGNSIEVRNAHEAFHFAIYTFAGSEWLLRSIRPAWRNAERYRVESMRDMTNLTRREAEHLKMVEALREGDGHRAVELLVEHLRSSAELVASHLEGSLPHELPQVDDLLLRAHT
jgi:DNA-binding GntR family transcriptional regulator